MLRPHPGVHGVACPQCQLLTFPPTNTPSDNSVVIEWQGVSIVEYYVLSIYDDAYRTNEIQRFEINPNNQTNTATQEIRNNQSNTVSQEVTGLSPNTQFWYAIRVHNVRSEVIATKLGQFQTLESGVSTPAITTNKVKFWVANGIVHFNKNVDNVSLIDMQGRMLLSAENVNELNVSNLKGMFVLRINNQNVKVVM